MLDRYNKQFFDTVLVKTWFDLKGESSRLYLSYLWWIVEPLMFMSIFYIVFKYFMGADRENFVQYLLVGIASWLWFVKCVNRAMTSIVSSSHIIQNININKLFFPLVSVIENSIKSLAVGLFLLVFYFIFSDQVTITALGVVVVILAQFIFTCGVSLLFAAMVPFLEDLSIVFGFGIQILFWLSGIFFDIRAAMYKKVLWILYYNPMAIIIDSYRDVLLRGQWPSFWNMAYVLAFSLCLISLSLYILNRFNKVFPRLVV